MLGMWVEGLGWVEGGLKVVEEGEELGS